MTEKEPLVVGQVWRVRKTGTLRRIARLIDHGSAGHPYHDVGWETVDIKPARRGATYEDYWRRNCELVERRSSDPLPPG